MSQPNPNPEAMLHLLRQVLSQVAQVLAALSDEAYRTRPDGPFEGTIGGHVRHVLDHVRALVDGLDSGLVDYDQRLRGTPIESQRAAAMAELERLERAIDAVPTDARALRVAAITDPLTGRVDEVLSTPARELLFVLSHTIHHNAMIGAMVRQRGGSVPAWFGYAPSTIAAMQR